MTNTSENMLIVLVLVISFLSCITVYFLSIHFKEIRIDIVKYIYKILELEKKLEVNKSIRRQLIHEKIMEKQCIKINTEFILESYIYCDNNNQYKIRQNLRHVSFIEVDITGVIRKKNNYNYLVLYSKNIDCFILIKEEDVEENIVK